MFMIKPEAMRFKEQIMAMIDKAGIDIKEWRTVRLTEQDLHSLYPYSTGMDWDKLKDSFLDREVLAAVVEGEDVIKRLLKTCGDNTTPRLCNPESIRYIFRNALPPSAGFSNNIIHRPKNEEEAKEHMALFFPPKE